MQYLKNRQEFLTGVIEYKESYKYKSQDIKSSSLIREVLENDITWGGSLLGRLINSTIRKAVIGVKVFRVNPLLKKLRAQLESIEGDYVTGDELIKSQAVIYGLFEQIRTAAKKPSPISELIADGALIDYTLDLLEEIREFPEKESLMSKLNQFKEDLEDLEENGHIEEEDEEEEVEVQEANPREKFKTSVVKILESVVALYETLSVDDVQKVEPKEKKYKIGNIYTYTNKKGERKKVRLISFTNQIGSGKDSKFMTKDDIKKGALARPSSVFVEFVDDDGNSISGNPTMEVDISKLSVHDVNNQSGDAKKENDKNLDTNKPEDNKSLDLSKFIYISESIDDPKVKSAYDNLNKYIKSSNIKLYIKSIKLMISDSKSNKNTGFEWADIIWPNEGKTDDKMISFGKQLVGNLKTSGNPIAESIQFSDVTKSVSLICKPILGLKNSPEVIKSMGDVSENIQSIIDAFESLSDSFKKISEKSQNERFLSYRKFMEANDSDVVMSNDANESDSDSGSEEPIFRAYRENFSEEDEKVWIASEEKKVEMSSKFENIKINIDTTDRVDPIVRIANIFGDAYRLFMVEQIPSGRPNGRISQKTWREYKYLGKGTGDWTPERGPNGPFASKAIFNKWEKGVMSLIEDQALRKIFANPNLSINGNPGAGQTLFTFMNDMLEDDALKDYDGARRRLLLKYFNIAEDKGNMNSATPTNEGKSVSKEDLGDPGQTVFSPMSFNIKKADIDDYEHSYILLNCESVNEAVGSKTSILMYILGSFKSGDERVLVFKYQVGGKDLFKYLEVDGLKEPQDDVVKSLRENIKINIGFIDKFPIKSDLTIKSQDLIEFINRKNLVDKKFKVSKAYILNVTKEESGKNIMRKVSIKGAIKNRPRVDRSIGLSDAKDKYNR